MPNDEQTLLARCARLGTSTWSDALDECGIDGVVRGLTQRSGHGRFAARAVTARETAGRHGAFARNEFGVAKMIAATGPGRVLMAAAGPRSRPSAGLRDLRRRWAARKHTAPCLQLLRHQIVDRTFA